MSESLEMTCERNPKWAAERIRELEAARPSPGAQFQFCNECNWQAACSMEGKCHISAPVSSTAAPKPFGWYDQFNDVLYRDRGQAIMAAGGGNTVTPLYAKPVSASEASDQIAMSKAWIEAAKCGHCGGQGWTAIQVEAGVFEQEQCQWCFEQWLALGQPDASVDGTGAKHG